MNECIVPSHVYYNRNTNCSLIIVRFPGTKKRCLNLGSYNYLGFAENSGPCAEAVKDTIRKYGVGNCSSRAKYGMEFNTVHNDKAVILSYIIVYISKMATQVSLNIIPLIYQFHDKLLVVNI